MGMGYGANFADVIEEKDLKKLCPKEYKAFDQAIDDAETDLEGIARDIMYESEDVLTPKIKKAFKALTTAFEKKTGGLKVGLGFHDVEESGDRYDDVNGAYFWVDGMYQITPAGKKFSKIIDRKFFVTFG